MVYYVVCKIVMSRIAVTKVSPQISLSVCGILCDVTSFSHPTPPATHPKRNILDQPLFTTDTTTPEWRQIKFCFVYVKMLVCKNLDWNTQWNTVRFRKYANQASSGVKGLIDRGEKVDSSKSSLAISINCLDFRYITTLIPANLWIFPAYFSFPRVYAPVSLKHTHQLSLSPLSLTTLGLPHRDGLPWTE